MKLLFYRNYCSGKAEGPSSQPQSNLVFRVSYFMPAINALVKAQEKSHPKSINYNNTAPKKLQGLIFVTSLFDLLLP